MWLSLASPAAANIWFCDGNGDGTKECLCIAWSTPQGETLEMRCPTSGGGAEPPGYIPPTWGGSGAPQTPSSPAPGMPLVGITASNVSSANSGAVARTKGEYDPSTRFRLPDECTMLFNRSPLGMSGSNLMSSYIKYRSGVGVKDPQGNVPCNGGRVAWTLCCNHDPYVFICDSQFNALPPNERMYYLIHEAMHVAGQLENETGTVTGPSDPPNSGQIQGEVKKACS